MALTSIDATIDDLPEVVRIDDEATALYTTAGVVLTLTAAHPFTIAEQARWRRSAELGRLFLAVDDEGQRLGFASLDLVDGEPYLDQLSVRTRAMRRGVGRFLLHRAIDWATAQRADCLWLTTYGHLPYNRPFYEKEGFLVVPPAACLPGVLHHLQEQRRFLPAPEHRVAMRRALRA